MLTPYFEPVLGIGLENLVAVEGAGAKPLLPLGIEILKRSALGFLGEGFSAGVFVFAIEFSLVLI